MTARDRIVVGVVAAVALLGGYWFLLLGPKRKEAGQLSSKISQARRTRDAAVADAAASRAAQAQYPSNYATVARLGKAVPADDDVPSLVYQLASVSRATAIDFRTVKLSTSAGAAASAPAAAPASKPAAPPAGAGAGATPAAATQSATAGLPPGAVVGQAGLPTMPFSFTFDGGFFRLSSFFARLQGLIAARKDGLDVHGRLLTIDGISLTQSSKGFPAMKASVAATAFLAPPGQGVTGGPAPGGPAQSSGQPASGKASPGQGASAPATLLAPASP